MNIKKTISFFVIIPSFLILLNFDIQKTELVETKIANQNVLQIGSVKQDSIYNYFKEKLNPINYSINDRLKIIKIKNLNDSSSTNKSLISITVSLEGRQYYYNIYLYINNQKYDMYYKVIPGEYEFRNIRLTNGLNKMIFFSTLYSERSKSKIIYIKKK